MLSKVYGASAPSLSSIKSWTADFKCGRTSFFEEDRPGQQLTISKECLAPMLRRNRNDLWRWFTTADETCIHHNTLKTREQLKQWVFGGKSAPEKAINAYFEDLELDTCTVHRPGG